MTRLSRFERGLYEEHVEEAVALYELRVALCDDPATPTSLLADLDGRAEAHLDALFLGGEPARCLSERGACAAARHVHARLLARHGLGGELGHLLAQVDLTSPPLRSALERALSWELDGRALASAKVGLRGAAREVGIWARAVGARRIVAGAELQSVVVRGDDGRLEALWALGRVGGPRCLSLLQDCALEGAGELAEAAAIAWLRTALGNARGRVLGACVGRPELAISLALCGGREAHTVLSREAHAQPTDRWMLALGLLGDARAIPELIEVLGEPTLAPAAADSLLLLTGLEPLTTGVVSEPTWCARASTAVTPEERRDLEVVRDQATLSLDPVHWREALAAQGPRLPRHVRIQLGRPASAHTAIDALNRRRLSPRLRGFVADELLTRYGIDVPSPEEVPFDRLRSALDAARSRAVDTLSGRWMCGGEVIS